MAAPDPTDPEFGAEGVEISNAVLERVKGFDDGFVVDGADVLELGSGPGRIARSSR